MSFIFNACKWLSLLTAVFKYQERALFLPNTRCYFGDQYFIFILHYSSICRGDSYGMSISMEYQVLFCSIPFLSGLFVICPELCPLAPKASPTWVHISVFCLTVCREPSPVVLVMDFRSYVKPASRLTVQDRSIENNARIRG